MIREFRERSNLEDSAGHLDPDPIREPIPSLENPDCRRSTGSAGQRFATSPFPDPQLQMISRHDLMESHVDPAGNANLEARPKLPDRIVT